jgi:hypothetical protein
MHSFKIDDIMVSSFGYDQTNVVFYVVTKTTKTTATLQQVGTKIEEPGEYHDLVVPDFEYKGREIRRKVQSTEGREYLKRANYAGAGTIRRWNGKPKQQTAWECRR